ncbi:MAG: hypothetical protein OJF49_002203 [Ktedonobacterales bacterium]|jgi:hypothetical protein|nr:MAG: hypothetical protein OJF49_002203 [Ktedonobacterales bacterium]
MKCQNCGYQVRDATLERCTRCGLRLHAAIAAPDLQRTVPLQMESSRPALPSSAAKTPASKAATSEPPVTKPPVAKPAVAKKRSKRVLWGLVALALIVAVLGTGSIFYANRGHGTPGGNANLVVDVPTATLLPTATATPKPTATSGPQVVTILDDALTASSHSSGWYTDSRNAFFTSDGYHIANGYISYAPIENQSNFNLAVQTRQVAGKANVSYFIQFDAVAKSTKKYEFGIDSLGKFYLSGPGYTIIPSTQIAAIHTGFGAVNTLGVSVTGSHIVLFINGIQVGNANDSGLASGLIGLGVEDRPGNGPMEVVFSNLKITKFV